MIEIASPAALQLRLFAAGRSTAPLALAQTSSGCLS